MEVLDCRDSRSVLLEGVYFPNVPIGGIQAGYYFPPYDLVPEHLRSCMHLHYSYTSDLINRKTKFTNLPQSVTLRDASLKPRELGYYNHTDFVQYGDVIANFISVLRGWNPSDFANEKGVVHTSLTGRAEYKPNSVSSRISEGPNWSLNYGEFPGITIDGLQFPVGCKNFSISLNTNAAIVSPGINLSGSRSNARSLISLLAPALVSAINTGQFNRTVILGDGYYRKQDYYAASIKTRHGVPCGVNYTIKIDDTNHPVESSGSYHSAVTYRMGYEFMDAIRGSAVNPFVTGSYSPVASTGWGLKISIDVIVRRHRNTVGGSYTQGLLYKGSYLLQGGAIGFADVPSPETPVSLTGSTYSVYASELLNPALVDFMETSDPQIYGTPKYHRTRGFESKVNKMLPDIRASASLSASDAMSTAFDVLQTNHIETIAELRAIGGLLSPLAVFRRWYGVVRGKSIPTFGQVIDDLTDVKLAYEFAIKPTFESAVEIVDMATVLKQKLADNRLPRVVVGKGQFQYDLSAEFPEYRGAELTTRSKVVVAFTENSLLMTLLGARALGIMPSLSAMWDVVPLSFIVDWFTKFSSHLESVDSDIFAKCLNFSYCTHSFTIVTQFDEADLEYHGLTSHASAEAPGLRFYRREKSRWYPAPRESRFNWHSPTLPSDWGIIGSVFYKLSK